MADLLLDTQTTPTTPASSKVVIYADSTTDRAASLNDAGLVTGTLSRNWATAQQGPGFAADTYVTGSGLLIPSCGMQVGQVYRWFISLQKTAAGTAAVVFTIRIGANQTTGDTSRWQQTQVIAQTAAADGGLLIVSMTVPVVHTTNGVLAAGAAFAAGAGLGGGVDGTGATFDNTALAGLYVGLSLNGGAAASWTLNSVSAELLG
jgi:hypothetical protein